MCRLEGLDVRLACRQAQALPCRPFWVAEASVQAWAGMRRTGASRWVLHGKASRSYLSHAQALYALARPLMKSPRTRTPCGAAGAQLACCCACWFAGGKLLQRQQSIRPGEKVHGAGLSGFPTCSVYHAGRMTAASQRHEHGHCRLKKLWKKAVLFGAEADAQCWSKSLLSY